MNARLTVSEILHTTMCSAIALIYALGKYAAIDSHAQANALKYMASALALVSTLFKHVASALAMAVAKFVAIALAVVSSLDVSTRYCTCTSNCSSQTCS